MTKLVYEPCRCLRRGDGFIPGTRGTLFAIVKGRKIFVANCPRCKGK